MSQGAWVLLSVLAAATAFGLVRGARDGRFRGTHELRDRGSREATHRGRKPRDRGEVPRGGSEEPADRGEKPSDSDGHERSDPGGHERSDPGGHEPSGRGGHESSDPPGPIHGEAAAREGQPTYPAEGRSLVRPANLGGDLRAVQPANLGADLGGDRPANLGADQPADRPVDLRADLGDLGHLGERATLLQFSTAFCAPCRAARRVLGDVAATVPGVAHVEVDAESHLDLVRRLDVRRTPTTLVLDAEGREVSRASGAPRRQDVLRALAQAL